MEGYVNMVLFIRNNHIFNLCKRFKMLSMYNTSPFFPYNKSSYNLRWFFNCPFFSRSEIY